MADLISDSVRRLIAEIADVDVARVEDGVLLKDLGLDSLDGVELAVDIEDKFGVAVPDEALDGILTVKDAIAYVEKAKGAE